VHWHSDMLQTCKLCCLAQVTVGNGQTPEMQHQLFCHNKSPIPEIIAIGVLGGVVNKGAGSGMAGIAAAIPIQNLVWQRHTNQSKVERQSFLSFETSHG